MSEQQRRPEDLDGSVTPESSSRPQHRRQGGPVRLMTTASAIALAAVGLASGASLLARSPAFASPPPVTGEGVAGQLTIADLVEKVRPAVVSVKVDIKSVSDTGERMPFDFPDLPKGSPFERFFKQFGEQMQRPSQQIVQGQGSGFFISPDGYIVTNNHVVDHAVKVTVTLDNGSVLGARVIGRDAKTDLALLKVEKSGSYQYVTFAKSEPRVGENVVAIGNPFGLGGTVTSGIISARGRDIGAGPYDDFLQIDAAVNRGNSGGPAFNLKGEVVGVNTAIYSPSGGSVGIGFAIPSNTVQQVVAQIKEHGTVDRGYLGVRTQTVTQELADGLSLKQAKGALIDGTENGTPAAKAGLKSGDVIMSVNGAAVSDARDLARKIGTIRPGSKVELGYIRDGKEMTATVEVAALPTNSASATRPEAEKSGLAGLGMTLAPADQVQGAGDQGVAVIDIDPSGAAARKGIRDGDIILEVGGKTVAAPAEVKSGVEAAKAQGRTAVLMKVKSANGTHFVAIPVPTA